MDKGARQHTEANSAYTVSRPASAQAQVAVLRGEGRPCEAAQRKYAQLMNHGALARRRQSMVTRVERSTRLTAQRRRLGSVPGEATQRQPEDDDLVQEKSKILQRAATQDGELYQARYEPVQRVEGGEPVQGRFEAVQQKIENRTGLPDSLKAGIESLSGMDMSDVRVYFHSPKPAQLNALAFAQGREIHLGTGQERHLPHEAWHVVQQAQGRVKPTMAVAGSLINDDAALEAEADDMGARAMSPQCQLVSNLPTRGKALGAAAVQMKVVNKEERRLESGYNSLVQTSEWHKEAVAFETRLGTFASHDARSNNATKKGLKKMADIFKSAYNEDEQQEEYLKPFGIDDPSEEKTSAGQVGKSADVGALREVVEEKKERIWGLNWLLGSSEVNDVNLRERMTAFYNGAYFGKGFGDYASIKPSLKKILHEIVLNQSDDVSTKLGVNDKMELAAHLGLDVNELKRLQGNMGSQYRRSMNAMMNIAESLGIAKNNFLFAGDVFGVGNLANETITKLWENLEMPRSHRTKKARDDAGKLAHAKTPGDYAAMGVPLSARERAFVNKNRKADGLGEIADADKLPWREGIAYYYVDTNSAWYKEMSEKKGFPVVSAISGTTARMMSAFKWLNLGNNEALNFRLAIMGWMLTSRDHSLYEILKGAQMVGVSGANEDTSDAVAMYLHIAPLTEEELRVSVCKERMFPHESTYVALTTKDVDFNADVNEQENMVLPGKVSANAAKVTKDKYGHGGSDKQTDLNLSHVIALRAYTGPDHHVLNALMQWFENSYGVDNFVSVSSNAKIADDLYNHVATKLKGGGAECPAIMVQLLTHHDDWKHIKQVFDDPTSTEVAKSKALSDLWTNCNKLAIKLKKEAAVHVNMLDESLQLLPPYVGNVYMGSWEAWGLHTGNSSSVKKFGYYQSTSKSRAVAKGFADTHKGSKIKVPVLYEIKLKGGGHGRDIEDFSKYGGEKEVLLIPTTLIKVKPLKSVEDGVNVHEADEA